jgi:hypothetical protein
MLHINKQEKNKQTYHLETVILEEGVLGVKGLPFQSGERVEVFVKTRSRQKSQKNLYPLRGKPILYEAPFDGVAEDEWDAVK